MTFVIAFGWASVTDLYLFATKDEASQKISDYLSCNIQLEDHCHYEDPYPMWVIYIRLSFTMSLGLVLFLVFGMQRRVLNHWKNIFLLVKRRNFRGLLNMSIEQTKAEAQLVKLTVGSKTKVVKRKN